MELTLTTLTIKEILPFIGGGKKVDDERILKDIDEMKQTLILISRPRFIYKVFAWENEELKDIHLVLEGNDIKRLLKESHHAVLLAATLGVEVDKEMVRIQRKDMGKALIFDACANAAIEHICDQVQIHIEEEYRGSGQYITDRYSCGYGDLPIHLQNDFLRALDTQKKIGLFVNASSILNPMKSVTAIIGVADRIQPTILRGCAYCLLKETCQYRKGGTTCGK